MLGCDSLMIVYVRYTSDESVKFATCLVFNEDLEYLGLVWDRPVVREGEH